MAISGEAMLNREHEKKGLVFYNKKRIYRVIDQKFRHGFKLNRSILD